MSRLVAARITCKLHLFILRAHLVCLRSFVNQPPSRTSARQRDGVTHSMRSVSFTLKEDFPTVGYEQWRALAEGELRGASFEQKFVTHTYEGIDIQPLYTRRNELDPVDAVGLPGDPPFVRSSRALGAVLDGWDLRQEYAHPDLTVTNQAILDDLEGGVRSLTLVLDRAARDGLDADAPAAATIAGRDGIAAYHVDDLDLALSSVHLELVSVALDAGAAFLPAAAALVALWRR